jgi:hypothetical protein
MRQAMITALVVIAATTALFASTASAAPAPPTQPSYEGCSDWYLQSSYPMSLEDTQWVFRCVWEDSMSEDGTGWWWASDYYWNAESSQVMWFASYMAEAGWYWSCVLYPYGIGMCDA